MANILRSQISMATNVRNRHTSQAHAFFDKSRRKNYRKPLLQRYVIRILLMYVDFSCKVARDSLFQGSHILCIVMGQYNVAGCRFLSGSVAGHI